MAIKVGNEGVADLQVAINQWGNDGNTGFFPVRSGTPESWSRSNGWGFVMGMKRNGQQSAYYVLAGESITISDDSVVSNDRGKLSPCMVW